MYFGSAILTESTFFGVGIVFQFGEVRLAAQLLSDAVLLLLSNSL